MQRIEELELIEKELREQLNSRDDDDDDDEDNVNVKGGKGRPRRQKDAHKIQELTHQLTFLQTDNQALSARVAELEENEETLRENWRRVADEDFNRTQCLEEKVWMFWGVFFIYFFFNLWLLRGNFKKRDFYSHF